MFFIYQTNKITGYNFGVNSKSFDATFSQFVDDNGPHYFENQMLWTARFFTALLGVGCVYLTFLISLKLFNNKTISLLSAAALAVMPLHVRNSHYALADIPQVFFFLLAFLASINIYKKPNLKAYIIAGFLVGFSTSLKYFPLPLIPFIVFHLLRGKNNFLSKKLFAAAIAMFFGYWLGMPYLFVHYKEITGSIPIALSWYGPDKIDPQKSLLQKILPDNHHAYHLKFLFNEGMLQIPLITSLIGAIIGLIKYTKATFLTLIIPVVNGIFIFFYVRQIYEQLPLPMLPFMAILIGVFTYYFISKLKFGKIIFIPLLLLVIFLPSFASSAKASIACTTPITEFQSRDWVKNNIPPNSNFAIEPGTRAPDLAMNWIRSEIGDNFSLSELQDINANYLIALKGYYGVYLSWSDDLLFPPKNIINNQYVQLVINEYNSSAQTLQKFIKPYMCISTDIYIYKIPPKLEPANHLIKQFNLDASDDLNNFNLDSYNEEVNLSYTAKQGHDNPGALRYTYNTSKFNQRRSEYYFYYATPVFSDFLNAGGNKKYSLSAWVLKESEIKRTNIKRDLKDFFLRIDFYQDKNKSPIKTSFSSRVKNHQDWQQLLVTSIAPKGTNFMKVGFGGLAPYISGSFLIDDINIYEK